MSATALKVNSKMEVSKKAKRHGGPLICPHSGREYTDITHSEFRNMQFTCGDCGTRLPLAKTDLKKDAVMVPKHTVPSELHAFRKTLERQEKSES